MSEHPNVTYDRPFRTLFEDGVHLLIASENSQDNDESNSLARGSIACTMMLPEVVANICIESLHLDATIFNEIDKLAPLAKFDYYLRSSFRERKLPSGVLPVQKLQELKRLRDTFVHPKRYQVAWKPSEDGTYTGESKRTQFLHMSANPTMWHSGDAVNAMQGVHDFLSFFFKDICKMSKCKATNLLFSDDVLLGNSEGGFFYYRRTFHTALKRWNINTSYFRIGVL
ncbi:MAG: hypothetical protein A3F73_06085 [Gallionellales bacterium RIFCSPLOWO2_12_FULL_59_22]|nr:MAG: hypothetical protein A3H99_03245 [Gallionellales bacterium RIFCSPLOWO2_02_FULL_59_110]OGT03670.1 MAG: hypothetical protein A2Z65_02410 [Gallionellales bacterium RIFCSPLOWO2_02_58_13]OGT11012.1 MAG: hypothetical protein A3F73_06085 [Gallionellales bacterium RIFCSPLOWO2_12_FULL_59_22]